MCRDKDGEKERRKKRETERKRESIYLIFAGTIVSSKHTADVSLRERLMLRGSHRSPWEKKRESTLSTNGPEKLITSLRGRAPAPNLKIYGGEDNPECILSVAITGERRRRNPLRKNAGNNFHLPPKCGSKFSCLPLLLLPLSLSLWFVTHVPRALIASVAILICSRARCNINAFAVTVRCYKSRDARARSNAR